MPEIEIGEYVRTTRGKLFKVENEKTLQMIRFLKVEYGDIVKHSKNLIDLIEQGDYVNGSKVEKYKLSTNFVTKERYIVINDDWNLYDWNIKTLLTKEQYELVQYKVGE